MKYELILFDLDNTLLDFTKSEEEALLLTFKHFHIQCDKNHHLKAYEKINSKIWVEFEEGKITLEELKIERFARFLKKIDLTINSETFALEYLSNLSKSVYFIKDASLIFEAIRKKYRISFITNGISMVQHERVRRAGFYDYIEELIISEEVGFKKPDREIFEHTLTKLNIQNKQKVLIIGDNLNSDIKGGIDFGIDTCWFNLFNIKKKTNFNPTYTIVELKELLDILEV